MNGRPLKYIFLVQGEGRGHMTQAITLSKMLADEGHVVSHVFIGSDNKRTVPAFFHKKIVAAETESLSSPGFVVDDKGKGIQIRLTVVKSLGTISKYFQSIHRIHTVVDQKRPDVLLNFYDPLGGLYNMIFRPELIYLCIGHQYLAHHQNFQFAKGFTNKLLFLINNKITSIGAKKLLALSFKPYSKPTNKKLIVLPPLLRPEVFQKVGKSGDFILTYILNKGYAEEIMEWHRSNREVKIHCFWENHRAPETLKIHPNLIFHRLSDTKFLELMADCKAYASTAGFESICEALFLGKPIMTVPVRGHYEQQCNAIDASTAGAKVTSNSFDLSKLVDLLPKCVGGQNEFHQWVKGSSEAFLLELTNVSKERSVKSERHPVHRPLALPQHAH